MALEGSQLDSRSSPVFFGGHEMFPFRYGWLKKSIDAVSREPAFFRSERAMIDLGVGKKMVQSIRYWSLASQLMEQDRASRTSRGRFVPTELGLRLFADDGFDPYMEDPATLWLLHWLIVSNSTKATTWSWTFSYWNNIEFTKETILRGIRAWLTTHGYNSISEELLKRDVDCFVRTYTKGRQSKKVILEDSLDCPLVDLNLISELSDGRTYQFQRGPQLSLPNEVFAFALLEFWRGTNNQSNTLAFAKIAHDPQSPGRVFKLDEDSLASRLELLEKLTRGAIYYDETAGLKQVLKRSESNPIDLLKDYYRVRAI